MLVSSLIPYGCFGNKNHIMFVARDLIRKTTFNLTSRVTKLSESRSLHQLCINKILFLPLTWPTININLIVILRTFIFMTKWSTVSTRQMLNRYVDFLVFIVIGPPLGLIITEFALQNIITVLSFYV